MVSDFRLCSDTYNKMSLWCVVNVNCNETCQINLKFNNLDVQSLLVASSFDIKKIFERSCIGSNAPYWKDDILWSILILLRGKLLFFTYTYQVELHYGEELKLSSKKRLCSAHRTFSGEWNPYVCTVTSKRFLILYFSMLIVMNCNSSLQAIDWKLCTVVEILWT